MSYDVWYEVEIDGEVVAATDGRNYTSNVARVWREAGCDIAEYHGRPVREFAQPLADAIATIEADPERFRAMDAPNGWGSAEGAVEKFLRPLLRDAQLVNESAVVRVSR